uniref:Carbohydrate sulfotransferase n=1 Tax=Cyprinodon variegatus TaxID=28743 RepID=A0A3Q2DHB0_CYPVA
TGKKTTQLQKLRKDYIRRMCDIEKKALSAQKPRIKNIYDHFIVEERQKIIYCFIPKVQGCACAFLSIVERAGLFKDVEVEILYYTVPLPCTFLTADVLFFFFFLQNRLMNYTKFMFVRDPFVRLISAYRSKFLYNQKNEYFYRKYGRIMMKLYGNQQKPPQTMKEAEALGLLPTFKNFVQYLVDPQTEKKEPFEPHWRQMHRLCHPCLIEYDFIGHQETLKEDAEELLKFFKLENDIKFPSPYKNMTTSNSAMDWFKAVPLEDRRKLYNIFELDFKLFGYKRPRVS